MLKKLFGFITAIFISSYAYQGELHRQFPQIVPAYLSTAGFVWEADTVSKYMGILCKGAVSPDADHPEFKIPENLIPNWAKPTGSTSIAKWEHCILDDVPLKLEDALDQVCRYYGFSYQYADSCAYQWLGIAETFWYSGNTDSAMFYLGRVCHLIQDITVPMHTHLTTDLLEAWRVVNGMELNQ